MSALDSIIGYDEIKDKLNILIDELNNPDKYEQLGVTPPTGGILLTGRPGLGKTLCADAFLADVNLPHVKVSRATEDNPRESLIEAFEKLKSKKHGIFMIDDLDKFAAGEDEEQIYATLQALMDKSKNVFVVATTNQLEDVPESLTRPGRLETILFKTPKKEDSAKIIEYYLSSKNLDDDVNVDDISKMMRYSSCAKLAEVINDAATYAAYSGRSKISKDDLVAAAFANNANTCDDYDFDLTEEDEVKRAQHEAGHTVVAEVLGATVGYVTIDKKYKKCLTHMFESTKRRKQECCVALGGKATVELHDCSRPASGCFKDLKSCYLMIMDGIISNATNGFEYLSPPDSHDYRREIGVDQTLATASVLEECFTKTKEILSKNKAFFDLVVDALLEKKTLLHSDIQRIKDSVTIVPVDII